MCLVQVDSLVVVSFRTFVTHFPRQYDLVFSVYVIGRSSVGVLSL